MWSGALFLSLVTLTGLADGGALPRRHLMVNGTDAKPGEYPFHTQVGCCSGALIAPDVVLTAGHVVPPESAVGMTVTVGAYYSSVTAKQGDPRKVTTAIQHPKYDGMHNDFCILLLDKPSEKRPIRINRSSQVPEAYDLVTLLGTGTFNLTTSNRSEVLQYADSRYIPSEECAKAYDPERGISYAGGFLDDTSICTRGDGDGCVFDSGGPVIVENNTLVGLISFGVDCGDPIYPAVNARVSAVHDWIDQIVCEYSSDPPEDYACGTRSPTTAPVISEQPHGKIHRDLFRWPIFAFLVGVLLGTGVVLFFFRWRKPSVPDEPVGESQLLLQNVRT